MSNDAAFREAVHRYDIAVNLQAAQPTYRNRKAAHEAREKVLALYAERQGEGTLITEFVVPMPHPDYPNTVTIMLGTTVNPGDRVRVVKEDA